jgi:hypothetical protein
VCGRLQGSAEHDDRHPLERGTPRRIQCRADATGDLGQHRIMPDSPRRE